MVEARKYGREASTINGLVKPSGLIIDDYVFDVEATRMFFDIIDHRYNKEGPNLMIFTSSKGPDKWGEFFSENLTVLCALDRIFDDATAYMIKGNSYRERKLKRLRLLLDKPRH